MWFELAAPVIGCFVGYVAGARIERRTWRAVADHELLWIDADGSFYRIFKTTESPSAREIAAACELRSAIKAKADVTQASAELRGPRQS